jgi:hypothetical protein
LKNIDDIRIISIAKYLVGYMYKGEEISTDDYSRMEQELLKDAPWNEYTEEFDFPSLDAEFAFRKFKRDTTALHNTKEFISEPITVGKVIKSVIDTGNPFISQRTQNAEITDGFTYDQPAAVLSIVKEKFDELGFTYDPNLGYQETANKKVWSNPNHSVIEYVSAFGAYIFTKIYKNSSIKSRFGDLSRLNILYNQDRKLIRDTIDTYYNLSYKNIDLDNSFVVSVRNALSSINFLVSELQPKKVSWSKKSIAQKRIYELRAKLDEYINENAK